MGNNTFLKFIILSPLIPLMAGCSDDLYWNIAEYSPSLESHYLSVYPRDFNFGNGEETKTGTITSENAWSFTEVPSWLSVSPASGNSDMEFSVTSAPNETMSSKTAVFYLSANASDWNQQRAITASQSAASPYFKFVNIENTSIYLDGTSHILSVDVETNIDDLLPKIYRDWGSDGWIQAEYHNKQLTISIMANEDGYDRSARVELWSSTYSKGGTIYIAQYKPNLSFNEITSLTFDADGGSENVNVTCEIPWFVLSKEPWIEITPTQGSSGSNQVKISVLPSYQSESRNGKVLFYYKEDQSAVGSVSISQTGRYLTLSPKSVTLDGEENSSGTITIDSNIGWEVAGCPEWMSLSPDKGAAGSSTITITAQKNNSLNSRSGTVTIKDSKTGGITSSVTVTQNGLDFGDNSTLEFGWQPTTQKLNVPMPSKWNAAVSDGWISLSQYTGEGATTCDVTVSRNDSPNVRTGEIIFSSEGQNITVSVVQEGQYITIDGTSGEVPAVGGSIELHINATVNIKPVIEHDGRTTDWVTYDKVADNQYNISVKYNPSINERTATFILQPTESNVKDELASGVRLKIKQFGRNLQVEPSRITLFAKGGTTESYPIIADGPYSIEKLEEFTWFTLVHDSSTNLYYIVATENKTEFAREGYITVKLIDLPQEEVKQLLVPIYQLTEGDISIIIDNFKDPEIW